jgi:hypothetical protein
VSGGITALAILSGEELTPERALFFAALTASAAGLLSYISYVFSMASIEVIRVLIDIENNTRQRR